MFDGLVPKDRRLPVDAARTGFDHCPTIEKRLAKQAHIVPKRIPPAIGPPNEFRKKVEPHIRGLQAPAGCFNAS
ncbi:hypothetical protein GN330_07385 [Nitratireductor sp. CAU 1489]|uniref:Uncharacterized protein n=1 Tax=Nitratireductor arenosus TaxID=2682096 RepID=A0A844QGD7_9HYPH|nr:hypothetical protein [Nitratireductor arenosus]